jgi:hypothetical protein
MYDVYKADFLGLSLVGGCGLRKRGEAIMEPHNLFPLINLAHCREYIRIIAILCGDRRYFLVIFKCPLDMHESSVEA